MGFELRDHTADVAVEATGDSLAGVFAAVADGLAAASCESVSDDGERFSFTVAAESREALLFDYLDELIYLRDVRAELPVDNEAAIEAPNDDRPTGDATNATTDDADAWRLRGSARGVPLASITARDVKAVTYSEMRLAETDDGWEAYVVFDV